eukprot:COSAG01_NODE_1016_length_12112_cov_6.912178_2_plen_185_part_00
MCLRQQKFRFGSRSLIPVSTRLRYRISYQGTRGLQEHRKFLNLCRSWHQHVENGRWLLAAMCDDAQHAQMEEEEEEWPFGGSELLVGECGGEAGPAVAHGQGSGETRVLGELGAAELRCCAAVLRAVRADVGAFLSQARGGRGAQRWRARGGVALVAEGEPESGPTPACLRACVRASLPGYAVV